MTHGMDLTGFNEMTDLAPNTLDAGISNEIAPAFAAQDVSNQASAEGPK